MGGVFSAPAQRRRRRRRKARSDAIDRQLEGDKLRVKRECKVLVLGSETSGKSWIVKQMKADSQGFSTAELSEYRPVVYRNVVEAAQNMVLYVERAGLEYGEETTRELAEKILDYRLEAHGGRAYLSPEIAHAIDQLSKDPTISKYLSEICPMDSAKYFFGEILRIGSPNYLPNITDVLWARGGPTGISETKLVLGALTVHLYDVGGQRSERKKWIHYFESVTSILFFTALTDYDQYLMGKNRMTESIFLFESVVNSRWFMRTSIILLLTEVELFKRKLPKVPLEAHFPEYAGGADINKATKYVLWKFMQKNRARLSVYPHLIQVTDSTTTRLLFSVLKETILQNASQGSRII